MMPLDRLSTLRVFVYRGGELALSSLAASERSASAIESCLPDKHAQYFATDASSIAVLQQFSKPHTILLRQCRKTVIILLFTNSRMRSCVRRRFHRGAS